MLMEISHLCPEVQFGEAQRTIEHHIGKLKNQQAVFESVLGSDVCQMAQRALAPSDTTHNRIPVFWSSGWGKNIRINHPWTEPDPNNPWELLGRLLIYRTGYHTSFVQNEPGHDSYHLRLATDVSALNFDFSKSYPMKLWPTGCLAINYGCITRSYLRLSGDRNGLHVIRLHDPDEPNSKWLIKPVSVGSSYFHFQAFGGDFPQAVMVVCMQGSELEWRTDIDFPKALESIGNRAYFQLNFRSE